MQTFIASIFVFGLLIFAHEFGHYLVARKCGIRVLELAIGFGPRIFGWRKNETNYSLRLFPLGGFCRMLGEDEDADAPDSFPQKSIPQRASVLAAGSLMNLLLALLVFFVIFFFLLGVPLDDNTNVIGSITEGSPADVSGLKPGDRVIAIEGEQVESWEEIVLSIEGRPDEEILLVIKRGDEIREFFVIPRMDPEEGRALIGIGYIAEYQKYRFGDAISESFKSFGMVFSSLGQVFTGRAPLEVTGPVGIIRVIGEQAQHGLVNLLWLTGLISISLGLINLLPIPALDGGRILFLVIEAIRGRPVDPEKEGFIHLIGFAILIALILLVTYNDLSRWDILPGR